MKSGLYLVYTSLLTLSVLSSCVLFILVVSEPSPQYKETVNVFGLSNVTQTKNVTYKTNDDPVADEISALPKQISNHGLRDKKTAAERELTFIEGLSQNSVIANGLPDTGQPPILISLADTIKLDLQDVSENDSAYANNASKRNGSQTHVTNATEEKEIKTEAPETLVVQARPMAEVKLAEEVYLASSKPPPKSDDTDIENNTETEKIAEKQPHEDIPSFSEWAQKQLAEAEKLGAVLNHSSQPSNVNGNANSKSNKLRSKNYANPACGAKVVAVNPEAGSASSILSPNRDEYMLNTCNSRIWFIVELCEPVQAQKVELANFELFSSSPKDFIVYFSDRFPTRDWTSVGQFTANNDKEVQSFDLYPHLFGKFIKVEMLSHYGSEHYCPISLFKVYGTSEFEVLEKENAHADVEEDDEILGDLPDVPISDVEVSKNLFGSARDAVMSIMKKAAQVLVKGEAPKNNVSQQIYNKSKNHTDCCTPSHIIVCDNCSETLYNQVYDLISCHSSNLMEVVNQVFVHETLRNTEICQPFGLDFRNKRIISFRNERATYMSAVLSNKYIAALCNLMAIIDKKVVLNSSYETELNVTSNLTLDKVSDIVVDESNLNEIVQMPFKDEIEKDDATPKTETKVPIIDETISIAEDKEQVSEPPDDTKFVEQQTTRPAMEETESASETVMDNVEIKDKETTPIVKSESLPETSQVDNNVKAATVEAKTDTPPIQMDSTSTVVADKSQNTQPNDEISDTLVMETENFLSELDQLISDPTTTQTTATPVINNQSPPQKESVFLRLSNRVKTLERNMSLSAQYLEELSRRYKKQVEEMQKSFEKTVLQLSEERKRTEERDQHNSQQVASLQEQLAKMHASVKILLDERDSWFGTITFFKFLVLQAIIISLAVYYIYRKPVPEPVAIEVGRRKRKKDNQGQKVRRKSVEGVSGHETPSGKKRRPSEEALHIARQSMENLDDDIGEWQVARKNRRRKTSILHRTEEEWMRQDSIGVLKENVIPLDEEEFIAPVSEPVDFEIVEPHKVNGGINNVKKPPKTRRLSSPAFLKTALSRQSSRSIPSPVIPRANPSSEPDEPDSTVQENGRCKSEAGSIKNKKRSFKNIFKKVF